jgi:hypothetical protein
LLREIRKSCKQIHPYLYAHRKPLTSRGSSCEF